MQIGEGSVSRLSRKLRDCFQRVAMIPAVARPLAVLRRCSVSSFRAFSSLPDHGSSTPRLARFCAPLYGSQPIELRQ